MSELLETKTICIGSKPISAYLQAVYISQERGAKYLVFKARGRNILRCIDVASILQRNGGAIRDVVIGSEKIPNDHRHVSTIQIELELR